MNKTTEIIKVVTEVEITYSTPRGRQDLINALENGQALGIDYCCNWTGHDPAEAKSLKSEVLDEKPESELFRCPNCQSTEKLALTPWNCRLCENDGDHKILADLSRKSLHVKVLPEDPAERAEIMNAYRKWKCQPRLSVLPYDEVYIMHDADVVYVGTARNVGAFAQGWNYTE